MSLAASPACGAPAKPLSVTEARFYLYTTLFVAGNIALPALCHLVPGGGAMLLPIYFFTLVAGWRFGLAAGLATAGLSPPSHPPPPRMPPPAVPPAISTANSITLRLTSGASSSVFPVTATPTCATSVCSSGASLITSTLSLTGPSSSATSTRPRSFPCNTIGACTNVLKPAASTFSVYDPLGRRGYA